MCALKWKNVWGMVASAARRVLGGNGCVCGAPCPWGEWLRLWRAVSLGGMAASVVRRVPAQGPWSTWSTGSTWIQGLGSTWSTCSTWTWCLGQPGSLGPRVHWVDLDPGAQCHLVNLNPPVNPINLVNPDLGVWAHLVTPVRLAHLVHLVHLEPGPGSTWFPRPPWSTCSAWLTWTWETGSASSALARPGPPGPWGLDSLGPPGVLGTHRADLQPHHPHLKPATPIYNPQPPFITTQRAFEPRSAHL